MSLKITLPNFKNILNGLEKELSKMEMNKGVTVGVHEDKNSRSGDANNATIGAMNQFGTKNIPARPWLDVGVESASKEISQTIEDSVNEGLPENIILERIGQVATSSVQEYMNNLSSPANANSTINKKGTNNPLIDTGELKQSVSYKISAKGTK